MNRRTFLQGVASTAAVGGGAVWYTYYNGVFGAEEGSAYSAWAPPAVEDGPQLLGLVRSAILASSPHNTQPWRFRVGAQFVELYLQPARSVKGLDPYLREAHIGMGCALENLCLASAARGYSARVSLSSGKLDSASPASLQMVARVDLSPEHAQMDELYRAIPHRHTNRNPYDPQRPLPSGFAQELQSVSSCFNDTRLFVFEDSAPRNALARVSAAANLELYSDPAVEGGNQQWIRWRQSDIENYKDGLTIDNFGLSPLAVAAAKLSPECMLKRMAAPSQRSRMYQSQMQTARLIGIIAVKDRMDVPLSLQAGRVWQRAHLFATARGVAARPCNEAIEMIDYERAAGLETKRLAQLNTITHEPSWQPTFLFLMGFPTRAAHLSPRRPVEKVSMV